MAIAHFENDLIKIYMILLFCSPRCSDIMTLVLDQFNFLHLLYLN